jgi:predicted DNA-binding transcriptional regulator YafY
VTLLNQIIILKRIHYLISIKATGTPSHFSKKIGISRATLYRYVETLTMFGAIIEYDRRNCHFYYTHQFELDLNNLKY